MKKLVAVLTALALVVSAITAVVVLKNGRVVSGTAKDLEKAVITAFDLDGGSPKEIVLESAEQLDKIFSILRQTKDIRFGDFEGGGVAPHDSEFVVQLFYASGANEYIKSGERSELLYIDNRDFLFCKKFLIGQNEEFWTYVKDLVRKPQDGALEVVISVDFAPDEISGEYHFAEESDEFGILSRVMFTTNTAAKNFKFIVVGYREYGDEIKFFEEDVLYSLDELTPEKPLVVMWLEQGTIPQRGISFTDENNNTRYFYLSQSGNDGSLFLAEFEQ